MTYLTGIVFRFTQLACCSVHVVTLTFDFQGQIFKWLYLRNGVSDWQETKVIWIEAMLDLLYDLDLWPVYDLDLGFSRSNFPIVVSQEGVVCWAWNEIDMMLAAQYELDLWSHQWFWPWIFKDKYWNSCISGMDGSCFIWNICADVKEND